MPSAKELYPKSEWGDIYFDDYQPILDAFGQIVIQVDDDDYQGDTRVLYRDRDNYGWLQFGWGSCSGCDALQACDTYADVQELIDDLQASIKWFDSPLKALVYFENHDWEGDYSWGAEQREFVQKCIKVLTKMTRGGRR